jgi:hypothetical protein
MTEHDATGPGNKIGGAAGGGVARPPRAGRTGLRPGHTDGMAAEQSHDSGGVELGRFLLAQRSRVSPADVGSPHGSRAPGLRREEVVALAGVSGQPLRWMWSRMVQKFSHSLASSGVT